MTTQMPTERYGYLSKIYHLKNNLEHRNYGEEDTLQVALSSSRQVVSNGHRASFSVAQISETINSTDYRRSRYSQKASGVIITKR